MHEIFTPFLCQFVYVFFIDILIYTWSTNEHSLHIQEVSTSYSETWSIPQME